MLVLSLTGSCAMGGDKAEPTVEAALAWRLDAMSAASLGPEKPDAVWKQCAALLDAAGRLWPQESRFPKLRALIFEHLGDSKAATQAIITYRKLAPEDCVAQLDLVNLQAASMETADAKVDYLNRLVDLPNLLPEVRAQFAVEVATLLAQKSPELAAAAAKRAVDLYPLPQATQLSYRYTGHDLPLPQRVAALLQVIQSDPNQPAYLQELATILAENGLAEDSLPWYDATLQTTSLSGSAQLAEFHELVLDYISQLAISGRLELADTMAGQLLDRNPLDADAWFMKLTVDRASSPQRLYLEKLDLARTAFIRRWNMVSDQVLKGKPAVQPQNLPQAVVNLQNKIAPVDPAPVLAQLKSKDVPAGRTGVIGVVSDLAWFEIYFEEKPQEAQKWVQVLSEMLPADSKPLLRLQGWLALAQAQIPQARDLLSKAAPDDALAAFGLLHADELEKKPLDRAAVNKLLDENRIGLIAAMLWTAFRADAMRPTTRPVAAELPAELKKFPMELLLVLNPQAADRIYAVHAEPIDTGLAIGSPAMVQVTLVNSSKFDIAIGSDALLRPELWFDAKTLGVDQHTFPGVAYDQIRGQIVLHARSEMTQQVRLDSAALQQAIAMAPGATTTINGDVLTNPIPVTDPATHQRVAFTGPGGVGSNFLRTVSYTGIALGLPSGKKQVTDLLGSRSAVDRLHMIDLLAAYERLLARPGADPGLIQTVTELRPGFANLRKDPSPQVAAWANYVLSGMVAEGDRTKVVQDMAAASDWSSRLLSLFAAGNLPPGQQREIATKLSQDPDATVQAAAAATVEFLDHPTTPATQPAK
jgi:tetratricopeptide (TPR) repeat protein